MIRSYKEIVKKAEECSNSVNKKYTLGVNSKWSYYFAKAILTPNNDISRIAGFQQAGNPSGTHISRDVSKKDYLDIANRLVKYCEENKQLPNYIRYGDFQIRTRLYTYMLARILIYYNQNKRLPLYVNVNSKAFTKPSESTNKVYDLFVKKFGKISCIDDVMEIISKKFKYGYYYDDQLSNNQVIEKQYGNCTDLTQMVANIAEALDYTVKCIHVKCRSSGTGHVFLKLKKKDGGGWFVRDPAAVCGGKDVSNVWCSDGIILGENPAWWMANRNR